MKVCLEPNCPTLTNSSRCERHTRARDRARGTRQERGYGASHDALRASYQASLNSGVVHNCWRCGLEIDPKRWHLGHDDHDRTRYRGPECVPCNVAVTGR